MRRIVTLFSLTLSLCFMGCESHQAKVDKLQQDYDRKARQFQMDCAGQYIDIPPHPTPKCQEEDKTQADAWKRLQEEKAKQ
jgi:hypothetical protein